MSATDRLDQIEARANAATQGPWKVTPWDSRAVMPKMWAEDRAPIDDRRTFAVIHASESRDAEFIAHARSDVPWLIEQVRQRDAQIAVLRSWAVPCG